MTLSFLEFFYVLVLPSYQKKGKGHPNFCLFSPCSLPTFCSHALQSLFELCLPVENALREVAEFFHL